MKNLIERVEREKPAFADNILEHFNNDIQKDINDFAISHYWSGSASVNLHDVIGTQHPDYAGKSWLNLLKNGKRMNINLPLLADNPGYYFETKPKTPSMYFIKVNDKTYVASDGNHRTCIAKFFFYYEGLTTLHGVSLDEFIIDTAFKNVYEKLLDIIENQNLRLKTKIEKEILKRDDTAGWKRDSFKLVLNVAKIGEELKCNMYYQDMLNFIIESQNPFRCFKGKYKALWRK